LILFTFLRREAPEKIFHWRVRGEMESGAPVAVSKAYDFVLWLLPKVEKFSRSYRFTVGERLSAAGLDVLLLLVEAAYATRKQEMLHESTRKINSVRYLLRLAKDLKLLTLDSHTYALERLDEIGRMVGGWRKAVDQRT
jgi:hypothetical protein